MRKNKILLIFLVMTFALLFPKYIFADTIHLTKKDFDKAYELRGRMIEEHEGEVWIDEQEGLEEWIESYCTDDGEWVEGYEDEETGELIDGHCTVGELVEGHFEHKIIEGHYENQLIPEHYEPATEYKGITAVEEYNQGLGRYLIKYNMASNTYILDEDINFHNTYDCVHFLIMDNVTINLDLNGHTLKSGLFNHSAIDVTDSNLHIYGNGIIFGDETGVNAVHSTVVIDNGKFNDFKFDNCDVTINDGSFINIYSVRYYSGDSNVVINNGNFFSLFHGLLLIDENVKIKINHGNFYGLYTGLEVLRNTNIEIHDANFYGLAFGALISTQASTFELEKASFNVDEDVFMNEIIEKFGFVATPEFPLSSLLEKLNESRGTICNKVGAIGIIIGNNDDIELDNFIADNFKLSKTITFKNKTMDYLTEFFNTDEAKIRYVKEDSFSIVANYLVIDGANQTYQYKPITIRANGSFDIFEKMLVDGKEVNPENYIVSRGSTIVTFSNDYLSTLSSGKHNISFVYINGVASTNLTIPNLVNPNTGDNIISNFIMFIISIVGLVIAKHFLRKEA